jgi:hypothetical protein
MACPNWKEQKLVELEIDHFPREKRATRAKAKIGSGQSKTGTTKICSLEGVHVCG